MRTLTLHMYTQVKHEKQQQTNKQNRSGMSKDYMNEKEATVARTLLTCFYSCLIFCLFGFVFFVSSPTFDVPLEMPEGLNVNGLDGGHEVQGLLKENSVVLKCDFFFSGFVWCFFCEMSASKVKFSANVTSARFPQGVDQDSICFLKLMGQHNILQQLCCHFLHVVPDKEQNACNHITCLGLFTVLLVFECCWSWFSGLRSITFHVCVPNGGSILVISYFRSTYFAPTLI
ncbi:hypothetical protein SRHO_G00128820 [Serrasalmus rhombeus]